MRGIVELAFLNQIEKEANIHIHELFDLVVGTSTGGVVALGVFYQGWSPKDSISIFQKLTRSAFSLRMRLGAPVIKSVVQPFCSFRYTSAGIEKALKDQFGETAYLFGPTDGDRQQADWVKVGVVICLQSQNEAGLVANYSRDPSGNSEGEYDRFAKLDNCLLRLAWQKTLLFEQSISLKTSRFGKRECIFG